MSIWGEKAVVERPANEGLRQRVRLQSTSRIMIHNLCRVAVLNTGSSVYHEDRRDMGVGNIGASADLLRFQEVQS